MNPRTLLIVEQDGPTSFATAHYFERGGWRVVKAYSAQLAMEAIGLERPDVVLLDLGLAGGGELELIDRARRVLPEGSIIVLASNASISTAVEAMRRGAENFLPKPFDLPQLQAAVDSAYEKIEHLRRAQDALRRRRSVELEESAGSGLSEVDRQIALVAGGDTTVLLMGETGVGKGWYAERIHALSTRARRPFVETNCAGLTAAFLDAELFGHEKGAFTDAKAQKLGLFEVANRSTLFLDEIGDLAKDLQPKLLKVLEKRSFRRLGGTREIHSDVRLIAATNRPLEEQVKAGSFREDLYYRLAVMTIRVPSLRERGPHAIAELASQILGSMCREMNRGPMRFHPDTLAHLAHHSWPGNVRELRNVIERALILAGNVPELSPYHLPMELTQEPEPGQARSDVDLTLAQLERIHIQRVLEREGGSRQKTAKSLGISRAALYDKLKRYELGGDRS